VGSLIRTSPSSASRCRENCCVSRSNVCIATRAVNSAFVVTASGALSAPPRPCRLRARLAMEVRRDLKGVIVDGRFRVEERPGGGGMGTVWRAQHGVSLQKLAMKTLDPAHSASPEARERFLREARAAAALRTRHVVRVVDAQMGYRHHDDPLPFLVMELLEGKDLQQVLDARGRLAP